MLFLFCEGICVSAVHGWVSLGGRCPWAVRSVVYLRAYIPSPLLPTLINTYKTPCIHQTCIKKVGEEVAELMRKAARELDVPAPHHGGGK